ncbi:YlxR family protein [Pengzhenrongella sicca]|uniref:YlxR family protein n=1 Tax=Pengzhenrongella sicca TaxID=2819238 RepID=A0A8A4ZJB2_9MICO|nr:YlxR family protein [Pengzhenrongella sicca]QTE30586.1 YlxR family protein [Pengzhenrongella sicca]
MSRSVRLGGAGPEARRSRASAPESIPGPVRTCVGCRSQGSRSVLHRVVATDCGPGEIPVLVIDTGRSLPGRGAWLHPDPSCLELAERRRAFPRALRIAGPVDTSAVRGFLAAREH